ncbi:MAG: hypothetical protein QW589_01285 [Candidatus Bathyarchaeia archaeon]
MISDDFSHIPFLKRLDLFTELKVNKVEALGYSYEELRRMMIRGNPLVLGALIDGITIVESERIKKLKDEERKTYFKRGRAWFSRNL